MAAIAAVHYSSVSSSSVLVVAVLVVVDLQWKRRPTRSSTGHHSTSFLAV